jgi:hypothetical protein
VPTSGDRRVGSGAAEQATELCGGGRREGTAAAAWVVLGRCGSGTLGGEGEEEEDSIWEIERWRGDEAAGRDGNERLSRFFSCRIYYRKWDCGSGQEKPETEMIYSININVKSVFFNLIY